MKLNSSDNTPMEQELFVMTIFEAMIVCKNRRTGSSTIGSKLGKSSDNRSLSSLSNNDGIFSIMNNQGDMLIEIEDDLEVSELFNYQNFNIEGKCNFERVTQLFSKYLKGKDDFQIYSRDGFS